MKIYYIYDALCGWCYGFSTVISKFYQTYKDKYNFEVISGGMMLGEREGPVRKIAPYIQSAYKTVEERTEIKFGEAFLQEVEKGEMILSSLMPARAMSAFKMLQDEDQVIFAEKIQKEINYNGKAPTNEELYLNTIKEMGVNVAEFKRNFGLPASEELTLHDFQLTQQLKVQGFPSVLVEQNGNFVMIAHGYVPFQQLDDNLGRGIEMLREKED